MLTDTLSNVFSTDLNKLTSLNLTNHEPTSLHANPETSVSMYKRYRDTAFALIDTTNPNLFYRAYDNEQGSFNGEGLHEKFIYQGQSVLDVSVGKLDYPWFAADGNVFNEITQLQLQALAMVETNPQIAHRLKILSEFSSTLLPAPFTRYYHYEGQDGVRALTVADDFNSVKLNIILTYME